jgi:outer membrane protein TolC
MTQKFPSLFLLLLTLSFSHVLGDPCAFAANTEALPVITPTPTPAPQLSMSIKDAIGIALDRNPNAADYRERVTEDYANRASSVSLVLPNLSGNASINKEKDPTSGFAIDQGNSYTHYVAQLRLVQPLYQGGALLAGIHYADKDIAIRKLDLSVTERDLQVSVIQAFYTVFANQETVRILKDTLAIENKSLETAERYYHIGRGQLLDVLQTKSQVALLKPQIETAENTVKSTVSQLSTLLHEDLDKSVGLIGSLTVIDANTVKGLIPTRQKLPEVARSETTIDQFNDKEALTLAQYNPTLNIQGTLGQASNERSQFFQDYSNGWTIGLYLTVPIFNGLASIHQRDALNSQMKELDYTQAALLDTVAYNETETDRDLDTANSVLQSSKEASDIAKASLREADREFRTQTINYLQLLTSQQNDLSAELQYVQAKGSYITALANYCRAAGIPMQKLVDLLDTQKHSKENI